MVDDYFKDSVKISFSKVKDDISHLDGELRLQREVLSKQNDILRLLNNKLSSIIEKIDEIEKKMPKIESENMSNQSINQLINHLITYQSLNHEEASNEPIKAKKDVSIRNDGVNQSFNQIITRFCSVLIYQSPNSALPFIIFRLNLYCNHFFLEKRINLQPSLLF